MENDADWISNVLWTDEANFSLRKSVNMQNCCIWEKENSHALMEKPLHDLRVTVWCRFTASFIITPVKLGSKRA